MEIVKTIVSDLQREKEDLCAICKCFGLLQECKSCVINQDESLDDYGKMAIFENVLQRKADEIRIDWIGKINKNTITMYRSPNEGQMDCPALYYENEYRYERGFEPRTIEERINLNKRIAGWCCDTLLFSSGMATISCLLQVIKWLNNGFADQYIFLCAKYFESIRLVHFLFASNQIIHTKEEYEGVVQGKVSVIFLETIIYDENLSIPDVQDILREILSKNDSYPTFILIDITLSPFSSILESVKDICLRYENVFIVVVESLLKMAQQGFEFSNCGRMSLYGKSGSEKSFLKIMHALKEYRAVAGAGISLRDANLLDFSLFYENDRYVDCILCNNKVFARALDKEKPAYIERIVHPALSEMDGDSPFCFIILKKNNYRELLKYLTEKCSLDGVRISIGDSFGFRNCRIELVDFINSINGEKAKILKIAIGKIRGVLFHTLLKALLDYES